MLFFSDDSWNYVPFSGDIVVVETSTVSLVWDVTDYKLQINKQINLGYGIFTLFFLLLIDFIFY